MGKYVGSWSTRGPWRDGPEMGLKSIEGSQAAMILDTNQKQKAVIPYISITKTDQQQQWTYIVAF